MTIRHAKHFLGYAVSGVALLLLVTFSYALFFWGNGNPFAPLGWKETEAFVYASQERCSIEPIRVKRKHKAPHYEYRRLTTTYNDYRFSINGKEYKGVSYSKTYDDQYWKDKAIREIHLDNGGYSISVWYDQDSPDRNTAQKPSLYAIAPLLVPLVFLPLAFALLYLAFRSLKQPKA